MKSIALHRAATCNKSYFGGGYPTATDPGGYAAASVGYRDGAAAAGRSPRPAVDDMDADISVGRPSPPASAECYARLHDGRESDDASSSRSSSPSSSRSSGAAAADYFGPLKKLGSVRIDKVSYGICSDRKSYAAKRCGRTTAAARHQQHQQQHEEDGRAEQCCGVLLQTTASGSLQQQQQHQQAGVKSFSIADILGHEPAGKSPAATTTTAAAAATEDAAKIVRPWAEEYQPSPQQPPCTSFLSPPPPPPPAHRQPVALFPHSLFIQHLQHQQLHGHHQQQLLLQHRPKSADYETSTTCTSGRSSTDGSDCCTSPEIASCTAQSSSSSSAAAAAAAGGGGGAARRGRGGGGGRGVQEAPPRRGRRQEQRQLVAAGRPVSDDQQDVRSTAQRPVRSRHQFRSPEPVQLANAAQEETQVAHRVHQPPDLRAGEALPVPEVPVAGGPGRDRVQPGPDQRAGDHVVPEQAGQDEEGLRGAEKGPGDAGRAQRAQDIPGDRAEHGHTEEEASVRRRRVRLADRRRPSGQVRRIEERNFERKRGRRYGFVWYNIRWFSRFIPIFCFLYTKYKHVRTVVTFFDAVVVQCFSFNATYRG